MPRTQEGTLGTEKAWQSPSLSQGFKALLGGAERALGGHDIPDGFLGAHSTGVIVSFQSTFLVAGVSLRDSCSQGWGWRPSWGFHTLSVHGDGWGGFPPGSEGLSLASCGLGRPCGTHRQCSPIGRPRVCPPCLPNAPPGSRDGHRPGYPTSTPVTSNLRGHLRNGRRPERPNEVCLG